MGYINPHPPHAQPERILTLASPPDHHRLSPFQTQAKPTKLQKRQPEHHQQEAACNGAMLQSQTAMPGAALRLRLLYRMLRVGELLALVAFVSWSSWYVPSAVAAVLRLAGSLLLNARFVFVLGNAIVLLLFALSRHDLSPSSSNDEQPAATATTPLQEASSVPPVAAASASSFPSFTTPLQESSTSKLSSDAMTGTATSFATPAATPPSPAMVALREAAVLAPEPSAAAAAAFEDKEQPAVRVNKTRAPRRSRSEKIGPRLVARRALSPELRRCESENGRRRRSSVTARDAEACWGLEDADEFRQQVEAFIARQTRFHREESMTMAGHCQAAPAFTGALAVVE